MSESNERVDIVVLSSTSIVRALVSAGLSIPHAQTAASLFMPHFHIQEQAELRAFKKGRMPRATEKSIASKRAFAILSMLDKELDRSFGRAEIEDRALYARRGSGIALQHMLRAEYHASKSSQTDQNRLLLTSNMRIMDTES